MGEMMGTTKLRERGVALESLTDKQKMFVLEYTKAGGGSGAKAAELAGYKNPGVAAAQLLKQDKVSRAIGKILNGVAKTKELEREEILKHLYWAVTRDPIDLVDEQGFFHTDLNKIPERMRACIDSFEVEQITDYQTGNIIQKIKVRMNSKLGAIDLAMKHKGLFAPSQTETKVSFDWDQLAKGRNAEAVDNDPVEDEIASVYNKLENKPIIIEAAPNPPNPKKK